ncbi:MAG: hypothetical protein ACI4RT_08750 [Candidatus Spyradenecus sp.]
MKRLLALILMALAVLATLWVRKPVFETSLLALVGGEHGAIPAAVTARGSGEIQAIASAPDEAQAQACAEAFVAGLDRAPFAEVRARVGLGAGGEAQEAAIGEWIDFYAAHPAGLLSADDRARLASGNATAVLAQAQAELFSPAPRWVPLGADPYGFLQRFLTALPLAYGAWRPSANGFLTARDGEHTAILVTLSLREGLADSPAELVPVVEHLEALRARVERPGVHLSLSGAPLHTAAVAGRCQREITLLSLFSLLAIAAVAAWAFRSARFLPQMAWVLACSALAGSLATLLCFRTLHVLSGVLATTLLGLTIDYAFHALLARGNPAVTRRSLAASCLTTELALLPLACSGITLLAQSACFIGVGLLAALLAALTINSGNETNPAQIQGQPGPGPKRAWRGWAIAALCALSLIPLGWVRFGTEITQLHTPPPTLAQAERDFRRLSGLDAPSAGLLLAEAPDLETLLERLEALDLPPQTAHLARFLPSHARRQADSALMVSFAREAKETFAEFFEESPALEADAAPEPWKLEALPALLRRTFLIETPGCLYALIPCAQLPPGALPEGVRRYAPQAALADFLSRCQRRTLWLLGLVAVPLIALLFGLFGRRALRLLLPPLCAVGAVFSALTVRGEPVNLFHLLACFMLIGMALDYAIFLSASPVEARKPVTCSFLTSLAGFGALACVSFALVRSLGETFAIGLMVAYTLARLLFPPRKAKVQAPQSEFAASAFGLELLWLSHRLFGLRVLAFFAQVASTTVYLASPTVRKRTRTYRCFSNFVAGMVDKFAVMTGPRACVRIVPEDSPETQRFMEAVSTRRGVFFVSSHLGCIEVLPALADTPVVTHAFMRLEQTEVFNRFYLRHFRRQNVRIHPVTAFGIGETMAAGDALDAGDCVLMAGDAPFGRQVMRRFCGQERPFPVGTFRLAHALGHPIYFVACLRLKAHTYRLIARELPGPTAEAAAEQFVAALEPLAQAYPDQWFQWNEAPADEKESPRND